VTVRELYGTEEAKTELLDNVTMTAEQQHKGVLTYLYNELNNFRGKFYFRMG